MMALAQDDGTVSLVDARSLRPRERLRALGGFVAAIAFSPDGRLLAVTGKRGQVTLWDAHTLRPAGELKGLPAATSQALAFSPDSRLLAAAVVNVKNAGGNLRVWEVRRHALTDVSSRLTSPSLAFSPDGRLLAAAAMDRGIEVRDAHDGGVVAMLRTDDIARSVAFSPDGRRLAGGQFNGKARLWSTASWKPVGRALEGHAGRVTEIEFTRDGRMLTTASQDGTVRLWDAATQKPIGAPLILDADAFTSAVFTPTGSRLFAVTDTGRGVRWDVSPEAWKRHACRVAGRELTPREWEDALPGRPYRTVCRRG